MKRKLISQPSCKCRITQRLWKHDSCPQKASTNSPLPVLLLRLLFVCLFILIQLLAPFVPGNVLGQDSKNLFKTLSQVAREVEIELQLEYDFSIFLQIDRRDAVHRGGWLSCVNEL